MAGIGLMLLSTEASAQRTELSIKEYEVKLSENIKAGKEAKADIERVYTVALKKESVSSDKLKTLEESLKKNKGVRSMDYQKRSGLYIISIDMSSGDVRPSELKHMITQSGMEANSYSHSFYTSK